MALFTNANVVDKRCQDKLQVPLTLMALETQFCISIIVQSYNTAHSTSAPTAGCHVEMNQHAYKGTKAVNWLPLAGGTHGTGERKRDPNIYINIYIFVQTILT